jgi:hypothetical protein
MTVMPHLTNPKRSLPYGRSLLNPKLTRLRNLATLINSIAGETLRRPPASSFWEIKPESLGPKLSLVSARIRIFLQLLKMGRIVAEEDQFVLFLRLTPGEHF